MKQSANTTLYRKGTRVLQSRVVKSTSFKVAEGVAGRGMGGGRAKGGGGACHQKGH